MTSKEEKRIYLSPNIFFCNNSFYFEESEDKKIKINKKNWHKYLGIWMGKIRIRMEKKTKI